VQDISLQQRKFSIL